jgi:hypothetical protein
MGSPSVCKMGTRKGGIFARHIDSSIRHFIHWPILSEKNKEIKENMGNNFQQENL